MNYLERRRLEEKDVLSLLAKELHRNAPVASVQTVRVVPIRIIGNIYLIQTYY